MSDLSDFLDLDLAESVELSVVVVDSLLGAFSVAASVFFVLLFFSVVLFEDGLVALSAGVLVVDDFADGVIGGTGDGFALTLALADGVVLADTAGVAEADGVMVAPTLAVAPGVALAFVEALVFVVVAPLVVPVVTPVVPEVEVTPTLKLGVTP